jgi:hypothetical protein
MADKGEAKAPEETEAKESEDTDAKAPESKPEAPADDAASPASASKKKRLPRRKSFIKGGKNLRASVCTSDVLLCGTLKKKSSSAPKRFQKRYFEATGHYLNYYKDESKKQLKGTLDLEDCDSVELHDANIILHMNYNAKVKLKAGDQSTAMNWAEGLSTMTKGDMEQSDSDDDDDEGGKKKKKGKKGKQGKKAKLVYPPDRPDTFWVSVTVLKAKELDAKDLGGSSDPYITISVLESDIDKKAKLPKLGKTSTIMKNLNPDWGKSNDGFGEELGSFVPRNCKLHLECYDYDSVGSDDLIGEVIIDTSTLKPEAGEYQWYNLMKIDMKKGKKDKKAPGERGAVMLAINTWDNEGPDAHKPVTNPTTKDSALDGCWATQEARHFLHIANFHANANTGNHGNLYYPYDRVCEHVMKGKEVTHRVMLGTGDKFENKHEVNCFCWYLFYKSVEKRQEFVSGSWLVQDPGHKLMKAISHLSYSRMLIGKPWNKDLKTNYDPKSFGSTHYIELCMLQAKMGSAFMPEDQMAVPLEKGGKCLGYYQNGIDIDGSHDDGSLNGFSLFCEKAHIVSGKIPPKYEGGQWLFIKAEHFGTQRVADSINHTAQLGKSLTGASKGPKHLRGPKRVENTDKKRVQSFCSLVNNICEKPLDKRYLQTDLARDEVHERAKVVGMSFMYPKAREIHESVQAHWAQIEIEAETEGSRVLTDLEEKAVTLTNLVRKKVAAWLTSVHEDETCDYLETRTGSEVILGLKELDLAGRPELVDSRAVFLDVQRAKGNTSFEPLFEEEEEGEEEEGGAIVGAGAAAGGAAAGAGSAPAPSSAGAGAGGAGGGADAATVAKLRLKLQLMEGKLIKEQERSKKLQQALLSKSGIEGGEAAGGATTAAARVGDSGSAEARGFASGVTGMVAAVTADLPAPAKPPGGVQIP